MNAITSIGTNALFGMGELLDKKQKDWARAKLRTDTIFLLNVRLENEAGSEG